MFVVDTLAQHGAERYLYEIVKSIDKERFESSILCTYPLTVENNFYHQPLLDLGAKVTDFKFGELFEGDSSILLKKVKTSLTYRMANLTGKKEELTRKCEQELESKFKGFDIISVLKIEVFNRFPRVFSKLNNLTVHLLSWGIQYYENPYLKLPDRDYKFVTLYEDQKEDVLHTEFEQLSKERRLEFFNFPLILDFKERFNIYKVPKTDELVVAVFSRLNFDQPTSMFLYAFHLLKKRVPKAKLFLYGKQNEKYSGLLKQTSQILGIEADVVFKGHTVNIKKTIEQDQISLGWMNIGQTTMGYSSIEISSYGLPVVFFNIGEKAEFYKNHTISVHDDLEDFVVESSNLLGNSDSLLAKSLKMSQYVKQLYSSEKRIGELEDFYLKGL